MSIKCLNCGADNRPIAKFCTVCGHGLPQVIAPKPLTGLHPNIVPHNPLIPAPQQHMVPRGAPVSFPRMWSGKQPLAEGRVATMDTPRKVDKGVVQKVAVAGLLVMIKPILALLAGPLLSGTTQQSIRLEEYPSGRQRSVELIGELTAGIQIGDWIAVWGKEESGSIVAKILYNYTTDVQIALKK